MDPIALYCPTKNHSQYKGYALEKALQQSFIGVIHRSFGTLPLRPVPI